MLAARRQHLICHHLEILPREPSERLTAHSVDEFCKDIRAAALIAAAGDEQAVPLCRRVHKELWLHSAG